MLTREELARLNYNIVTGETLKSIDIGKKFLFFQLFQIFSLKCSHNINEIKTHSYFKDIEENHQQNFYPFAGALFPTPVW